MSLLPQRKKSAEEIAKLREALGVPGLSPDETAAVEIAPAPAPAKVKMPDSVVAAPAPAPAEKVAVPLEPDAVPVLHTPEEELPAAPALAKPVRSLRKSEQYPLKARVPTVSKDSKLPARRHSEDDIEKLRRRDALGALNIQPPAAHYMAMLAHPALLGAGYVLAIGGAGCAWYDMPLVAPLACEIAALLVAGFVVWRKTLSRHHAAFILIIALFVTIFGALYYFPHLRNAA